MRAAGRAAPMGASGCVLMRRTTLGCRFVVSARPKEAAPHFAIPGRGFLTGMGETEGGLLRRPPSADQLVLFLFARQHLELRRIAEQTEPLIRILGRLGRLFEFSDLVSEHPWIVHTRENMG